MYFSTFFARFIVGMVIALAIVIAVARWAFSGFRPLSPCGFSFCESVTAAGPWHIRRLTAVGQKFGGGADTLSLCGRKVAWDMRAQIQPDLLHPQFCCNKCAEQWKNETTL
jgi:hypothetical protein